MTTSDTPSSDDVFNSPIVIDADPFPPLEALPPIDEPEVDVDALLARAEAAVADDPDPEPEKSIEERWADAERLWKQTVRAISVEWDWPHTVIDYNGDWLGIRIPSQGALTAFTLGTDVASPDDTRSAMTTTFIRLHMSPRSFLHVFSRMMNPDDDYTDDMLGALMRMLVEKASTAIIAEAVVKAEEEKAAAKAAKLK